MVVLVFWLLLVAAGLGGYALLARLGLPDGEAWVAGRVAGLVAVTLPAWWLGVAGVQAWQRVGQALLALGALAGLLTLWQRRRFLRPILAAEALLLGASALVLLMRLDRPEISGTEKPMDLGILASLLHATSFPPPDMWLAGHTLPYYYWGSLVWVIPLSLGVPLGIGYNLVAAAVGGLAIALAFALGRRFGGTLASGALAAFFAVLAGTPDGVRQLLAGGRVTSLSLWDSSRQIAGTITEYPLFTMWLGDLHPHWLAMPLALTTILVAVRVGERSAGVAATATLAALFGATWAANPWAMPVTAAAVALMLLGGGEGWRLDLRLALVGVGAAVGGLLLYAPFHLAFRPPFAGFGLVRSVTRPMDLLLWGGCLVVPALLAAVVVTRRELGETGERERALGLATLALVVLAAAASLRPTLVLLVVSAVALAGAAWARTACPSAERRALALGALGLLLLAVPEVLYVKDPYGAELHRMNTVFKAYIQAWVLLAVALPVLLRKGTGENAPWRRALTAVLVAVSVPHLVSAATGLALERRAGLDGLRFMNPGDRAMVTYLERQPAGSVLVEAVGDAYSEFGRLSAASGVPALLGWANHESVWRGDSVTPELDRRRELVERVYGSSDPAQVRLAVAEAGADLVAVGKLERLSYPQDGVDAVLAAGEVVLDEGGAQLVRFPRAGGPTPR